VSAQPFKLQFPITVVSHRSSLSDRESLYESTELPKEARDFAALLASKVYYFLGEYDESLSFALGAGKAFEEETYKQGLEEYVETIVCQCFISLVGSLVHPVSTLYSKSHRSVYSSPCRCSTEWDSRNRSTSLRDYRDNFQPLHCRW